MYVSFKNPLCALFNGDSFCRNSLSVMKYENDQDTFFFSYFVKIEFWCW